CNWFESTDPLVIASGISGNVRFTPFLFDGTDTDPATSGFQPATTCVVVPVTLSSFTGYWQGKNAMLKWVTQMESNNRGFDVQRSLDGRNYSSIGMVQGAGNSSSVRTYQFEDALAGGIPGYIHYRLKQLDYDGRFSFSNVVLLKNENHGIFTIYPNPVKGIMFVKLAEGLSEAKNFRLFNSAGQLIKAGMVTGDVFSINAGNLPAGTYLLKLLDTKGKMLARGTALVN
ncbi:MAG: T9SS type A sorting domain-containing protein, partial [Chitinophagaceae bacterium]